MKYPIPFRIIVDRPLPGVVMQVQKGKDSLLPPTVIADSSLVFDFDINVDLSGDSLNFLGTFVQGPRDARFVYVNSGTYAGQTQTCWSRRAKLSLMTITKDQIDRVLNKLGSRLEARIPGAGRDGGPTCASVKGFEWRVTRR